jgi:hypothetical protein
MTRAQLVLLSSKAGVDCKAILDLGGEADDLFEFLLLDEAEKVQATISADVLVSSSNEFQLEFDRPSMD